MIQKSVRGREVTYAGGNLFRIAADHLGDATQWTRIALANGMVDPWFRETRILRIPPRSPQGGNGGILGPI